MPNQFDYLSEKYKTHTIKEVNERLIELTSLFEISQLLNSSLDLEHVLNNLLLIPMGRLMLTRGMIFLREGDQFLAKYKKGLSEEVFSVQFSSKQIPMDAYFSIKNEEDSNELKEFTAFMKQNRLFLSLPLSSEGKSIGLVLFGSKINKNNFSNEELNFLESLANISTPAIENASKVLEVKKINQELDQRIQQLRTLFDIAQ